MRFFLFGKVVDFFLKKFGKVVLKKNGLNPFFFFFQKITYNDRTSFDVIIFMEVILFKLFYFLNKNIFLN